MDGAKGNEKDLYWIERENVHIPSLVGGHGDSLFFLNIKNDKEIVWTILK